jgi:hypothetical protein
MKSKQLNFFSHPDDLISIESFFLQKGAVIFRQPTLDINASFSNTLFSPPNTFHFNKVFVTKREFAEKVFFRWVEAQKYFLVQAEPSYVVEFSFDGFSDDMTRLDRSRLYFVKYDNASAFEKDANFIEWANEIIKGFKSSFLRSLEDRLYSEKVLHWMKNKNAVVHESGLFIEAT